MRSFLGVPIASRQGVIGELYLTEKLNAEEFSEEDEHPPLEEKTSGHFARCWRDPSVDAKTRVLADLAAAR